MVALHLSPVIYLSEPKLALLLLLNSALDILSSIGTPRVEQTRRRSFLARVVRELATSARRSLQRPWQSDHQITFTLHNQPIQGVLCSACNLTKQPQNVVLHVLISWHTR